MVGTQSIQSNLPASERTRDHYITDYIMPLYWHDVKDIQIVGTHNIRLNFPASDWTHNYHVTDYTSIMLVWSSLSPRLLFKFKQTAKKRRDLFPT